MDSPLGKACDTLVSIQGVKQRIKKEEEIGQRSGYVRKDIIYQGHRALMALEEQLEDNKKEYRGISNKEFKPADCNNHEKKSQIE